MYAGMPALDAAESTFGLALIGIGVYVLLLPERTRGGHPLPYVSLLGTVALISSAMVFGIQLGGDDPSVHGALVAAAGCAVFAGVLGYHYHLVGTTLSAALYTVTLLMSAVFVSGGAFCGASGDPALCITLFVAAALLPLYLAVEERQGQDSLQYL